MQECYFCLNNLDDLFRLDSNNILVMAEAIAKEKFQGKDFIIC